MRLYVHQRERFGAVGRVGRQGHNRDFEPAFRRRSDGIVDVLHGLHEPLFSLALALRFRELVDIRHVVILARLQGAYAVGMNLRGLGPASPFGRLFVVGVLRAFVGEVIRRYGKPARRAAELYNDTYAIHLCETGINGRDLGRSGHE